MSGWRGDYPRVAGTAGFDEDEQTRIEMAVHESVINPIWHGNKNDSSKRVYGCSSPFFASGWKSTCGLGYWIRYQTSADPLRKMKTF